MTGITLDQARRHIGAGVVYRPYPGAAAQDGDITAVNDTYVFVRYTGDRTAKATHAEDLTLLCGAVDAVLCDECGTHTTDPETCPHGREHCPECRENGYACNTCRAETDPRWNR